MSRRPVDKVYKSTIAAIVFSATVLFSWTTLGHSQQARSGSDQFDLHRALAAAVDNGTTDIDPSQIDSCSGCCSSHGGITSGCAGNGHVICQDGTVSPSCLCSSCGTSPPPPPTCDGGSYWNGFACVCPSGEEFVNGVCTTPTHTCSGGMIWNGSACACPRGQEFILGQCQVVQTFTIGGGISGSWYDPAQSGHGFLIEVIKGTNQVQAVWFAFDNQANQAWIVGEGEIAGDQVVMSALLVQGGRFPPHFNASNIERQPWGTLSFTFLDCDHATLEWTTSNPDFTASGTMNLQRLTQIEGTSCP